MFGKKRKAAKLLEKPALTKTIRQNETKQTQGKKDSPYASVVEEYKKSIRGRPNQYDVELTYVICDRISKGESLKRITAGDNMPAAGTVYRWLDENPDFQDRYCKAKDDCADAMVEECLEIADNATNDFNQVVDPNGEITGWKANNELVNRSRLRVDTRKWIAARLKPGKYADRTKMDHTSSDGSMTPRPAIQAAIIDASQLSATALEELMKLKPPSE